jgi:hypothetical protein
MAVVVGQIWRDDCYYLDSETGECKRKFVLTLAVEPSGDTLTAVFTSRPNGLPEEPACSHGPPRAGYFMGVLGQPLVKPTWVDFSSVETLDEMDLKIHLKDGRKTPVELSIGPDLLCLIIRCLIQSEDLTKRQIKLLGNMLAELG